MELPQAPPQATLQALADAVSAENLAVAEGYGVPISTARDALAHGIGWVTLYGAISACSLSLLSFLVFGGRKETQAVPLPAE